MSEREPEPPRYCPNCGARTSPGLTHCAACGQPLAEPEELARLWGVGPAAPPPEVIDLYQQDAPSLQTTTPFTQTKPFEPQDREEPSWGAPPTSGPSFTPMLGREGREARDAALAEQSKLAQQKKPGGPPGCVLGCIALVLIAAIGALLAWSAGRGYLADRIEDELTVGIANELRTIDRETSLQPGVFTLTEEQINADIERNADLYDPVSDVAVALAPDRAEVRFQFYGVTSTFRAGLAVEGGRVVVVEPSLSGPAGRVVEVEEIETVFERELNELLARQGLQASGVTIDDDAIVLTTAPA